MMDMYLTRAFDELTAEEVDIIEPDAMSFNLLPEVYQRIQSRVLHKIYNAEPHSMKKLDYSNQRIFHTRKRITPIKVLIVAAILCAILAVSVLAIHLSGKIHLAQLFGESSFDIIDEYVLSDISQASNESIILSLESALTDGHFYYAVFSVSSIDGSSMAGLIPDIELNFICETPSRIKPAYQVEKLYTSENTESSAYYIALVRSDNPLISMTLSLLRMYAVDNAAEEIDPDLSVEAKFIFCPLATGGNSDGIFKNIELSPFCLWIDVYEAWENDNSLSSGLPIHSVFLKYKNGVTVGATAEQFSDSEYMERISWGGIQYPNGTNQSFISISFSEFINTSDVDAVVIDGVDYPVRINTLNKP